MPYQVQQIIEGKGKPVCVFKDDTVSKALALMIEYDFSQLPVVFTEDGYDVPDGMITYEGILRGIRNFKAGIDDLKVRDVMVTAPIYGLEDDLFDILDRLKDTNAVLITDGPDLEGIVTSFDTTEYFRNRTEDLMRVEDIELMIKEFIKAAYLDKNGELDELKLKSAIVRVTAHKKANGQSEKPSSFDDMSLSDYIILLLFNETWKILEPILGVQKSFVNELLQGIREIRNALAHFRGDISAEQRDKLKFGAEWLARCHEEYQVFKERQEREKLVETGKEDRKPETDNLPVESVVNIPDSVRSVDFSVSESSNGGGRYAPLADWLQSQPGRVDQVQLTFNQIEEIISVDLPASARIHRAWWANDSVGHSHSQLWLDAGWRTTYIHLNEGRITFSRIREREKAYITFFSKLLDDLRKTVGFPIREVSPDGTSWIVVQTIPRSGASYGSFTFSFTRDRKLRVELYLDLGDQIQTKSAFDKLFNKRNELDFQLGDIKWERLDSRRASRLALYREGLISEENEHAQLRKWAIETMVKFYNVLLKPAETAIIEAKNG